MNELSFLEKSSPLGSSLGSRRRWRGLSSLLALCLCASGCDSEGGGDDDGGMMAGAGVMAGSDGGAGGEDGGADVVDEGELYLTYTRVVNEGGETRGDLIAFDMRAQVELWLNEGLSTDDVDCITYGCALHHELSWVAWIKRVGTSGELWLAPINKGERSIDVEAKRLLSEAAVSFTLGSDKITFTEIKDPSAAQGIAVKSAPLEGGEATEHDLVGANGGFSVGRDDDLLVVIKTTLSSMTLFLTRLMSGQITELHNFGEEGGTGSPFSATSNPVNLAPRGDYFTVITNNEFMWRLHSKPLDGGELSSRDLFPVASSEEACSGDFPFTQVLGAPKMSRDGEHLYLLFSGDCSKRENSTANRLDYDVYRFNRDVSAAPLNVTRVISFNGWSNHDIGAFDVSPDESKVAFTATRPNQSGVKAIWLQEITEGAEEDPTVFDCSRDPNVNPLNDITGQRRCEFIVYEGDSNSVEYRHLKFITAEGL